MRGILLLIVATFTAGCAGSSKLATTDNQLRESVVCNRAIARLLADTPSTPNLGKYRSDAKTTLSCLREMEVASSARSSASEAKRRAKLVLNTSDAELARLVTQPPFLSQNALIRRLAQEVEELQRRIGEIDGYNVRLPTDAGDVFLHRNGI